MSDPRVEEIRVRRAKISEGYEAQLDDATDDDGNRQSSCLVLYVGGSDWFVAHTEQEGIDVEFVAHAPEYIDALLTKLDEAENPKGGWVLSGPEQWADIERRLAAGEAAEERERILIAGVREALAEYESERHGAFWKSRATAMRAILSRLLPSIPTEEEEAQEEEGPFMDHTDRMAEWMIEDAERDTSE